MTAARSDRESCAQASSDSMLPLESSEQLIDDARAGNLAAFNELITAWRSYLIHIAENETPAELKQKIDASDIVQDTCLDIHQHFEEFRGTTDAEWCGWLKRILIHDVRDACRRYLYAEKRAAGRERRLADSAGLGYDLCDREESPSDALVAEEEVAAVRQAIAQLPKDYRTALRLRNWDCLSFAEVGKRMQRSEEAARKLCSRAVLRLQEFIVVS